MLLLNIQGLVDDTQSCRYDIHRQAQPDRLSPPAGPRNAMDGWSCELSRRIRRGKVLWERTFQLRGC